MAIGVPLVVVLFAFLVVDVLLHLRAAASPSAKDSVADGVATSSRKLGPVSTGAAERASSPSAMTVVLWIAPGFLAIAGVDQTRFARGYAASVPEGVAAMVGALLLFLLPIDWNASAASR